MKVSLRGLAVPVSVLAVVVVLDQLTKTWAENNLAGSPRDYGLFRLLITYNEGSAFSFRLFTPGLYTLLALTFALGVCAYVVIKSPPTLQAGLLAMLAGGALGNALDRVLRDTGGSVVDFIDFKIWPVFNLADAALSIGVVGLFVFAIFEERRSRSLGGESAQVEPDVTERL